MEDLKQFLMKELECPVCLEYMSPPITLCKNGHNICNTCKPGLQDCPICRGDLINVRNKYTETVATKFLLPCKFQDSGCKCKFYEECKKKHENVCRYGPHKCPYYILNECDWEGAFTGIKQHLENSHKTPPAKITTQGKQSSNLLDYMKYGYWHQVVFWIDNTFFLHCKIVDNHLYMCYMYVGSKEDNNKYKYRVTIGSADGKESVSVCLKCPQYMKFIDRELPNEEYATFHKAFTKKFITEEGNLPYQYEINQY